MIKKKYTSIITEYESVIELTESDQNLIVQATNSASKAFAPYSNFKVGSSVLLKNNEIVSANNQENSAYPSGLCAERIAVFYANSKYPNIPIKTIAICAFDNDKLVETPISPCGECRQVLLESELRFNNPIRVIMVGSNKIIVSDNVIQLLPLHFEK